MTRTLKKTVALVGMMGAGKSAVGKALAERLNVAFLDSDQEIEAASNLSISEIFARYEGFDAHANAVSSLRGKLMEDET